MTYKPEDPWHIRRRVVLYALAFNAIVLIVTVFSTLIGLEIPESVQGTIITSIYLSSFGIIGTYVFGAAWDDRNKLNGGGS